MSRDALRRARALQRRLLHDGFVWPDEAAYLSKVREEVDEVEGALDATRRSEEIGDLLLACSGLAAACGVDPSEALNAALDRFANRYEAWQQINDGSQSVPWSDRGRQLWSQCKELAHRSPGCPYVPHPIAVVGAWDEQLPEILNASRDVGQLLARIGAILVTGGGPGVMAEATRAANLEGGLTVGFLGSNDPQTEGTHMSTDVIIPTGLGWDVRSSIMLRMVKALVVVGGAVGTLQEITMAYVNRIPIFVLECGSSMEQRIRDFCIDGIWIDHRRNTPIIFCEDVRVLGRRLGEL